MTNKKTTDGMQVSVLQENFAKALSIVSPAVGKGGTLPILNHVLLETDDGRLKITGCNLTQAITAWVGAKVESSGAVALPAKTLQDLVNSLMQDKVDIGVSAVMTAKIVCVRTAANLKGLDGSDFPISAGYAITHPTVATIPVAALKRAIGLVAFAAATDESRPMLTGVHMAFSGDCLTMTATDGFRMSVARVTLTEATPTPVTFLVPAKTLHDLARVLPSDGDERVTIQAPGNGRALIFHTANVCVSTQVLDQKFLEVEHIIPKKHTTRAIVNRAELLKACRQASVFAREALDTMRLSVEVGEGGEPGVLSVTARADETGDGHAEIEAVASGDDLAIAFNVKYLSDALSVMDSPQVAIELSEARKAGAVKMVGDDSFLYVLMPMNLPKG